VPAPSNRVAYSVPRDPARTFTVNVPLETHAIVIELPEPPGVLRIAGLPLTVARPVLLDWIVRLPLSYAVSVVIGTPAASVMLAIGIVPPLPLTVSEPSVYFAATPLVGMLSVVVLVVTETVPVVPSERTFVPSVSWAAKVWLTPPALAMTFTAAVHVGGASQMRATGAVPSML